MKRLIWLTLGLFLAGCGIVRAAGNQTLLPPQDPNMEIQADDLPDFGPAPELTTDVWLNTETNLRLADLKGKVVLVEMWTFGCINCKNVIPSLINWHEQYAEQGLVIIGNHYPEFEYEKDVENLKKALADYGIEYAVTQDNEGKNWRAFSNQYWPTLYLIDKEGRIRYEHIGEGNYEKTEKVIQTLLHQNH